MPPLQPTLGRPTVAYVLNCLDFIVNVISHFWEVINSFFKPLI